MKHGSLWWWVNPSTHRRRESSALELSQVCFWCWIAFVNLLPFSLYTLYNTEFAFPEFCLKASLDCLQNQVHVPESGFPGLSDLATVFIHPRLHWAPEAPLPALPAPLCRPPSLPIGRPACPAPFWNRLWQVYFTWPLPLFPLNLALPFRPGHLRNLLLSSEALHTSPPLPSSE